MNPEKPRRWMTEIWFGDSLAESVTIYGESLSDLRTSARDWLRQNRPNTFANAPRTYAIPNYVKRYLCSDGQRLVLARGAGGSVGERMLEPGCHLVEGLPLYPNPILIGSFEEAVSHFAEEAVLPKAGPDHLVETGQADERQWVQFWLLPSLYAAMVGMTGSLCYLAAPVENGSNWLLATGTLIEVVTFIGGVTAISSVVGMLAFALYRHYIHRH